MMNDENKYIMFYDCDNYNDDDDDEIPINLEFINNDEYQTKEILPNYEKYMKHEEDQKTRRVEGGRGGEEEEREEREEECIEITEQQFKNKKSEETNNEHLKIPSLHEHCAFANVDSLIKAQEVSLEGNELKNGISSIFSTRKNMPKNYIFLIHENYLMKKFNFMKMTRDERRCNEVYYNKYAQMKNQILQYLENHKKEISNKIFNDYKYKKAI